MTLTRKITALGLVFFAFLLNIQAQDDCTNTLDKAQKLYESGIIQDIPSMLEPCIQSGFTSEERLQAYKLIILSNLFDGNKEEARKNMLAFLRKYPEYTLAANDPAEFAHLFGSFLTHPLFSIGLFGGLNFSSPRILEPYSTDNYAYAKGKFSTGGTGFQAGIRFSYYLREGLEINFFPAFSSIKYRYSITQYGENYATSTADESMMRIDFPVSCSYDLMKGKIRPYLRAGICPGYVLSATSTEKLSVLGSADITGTDLDVTSKRESIDIAALLGAGVKYKIKGGFLCFDLRYNYGLRNMMVGSGRWSGDDVYRYLQPSPKFAINNFGISVGFVKLFYKPRFIGQL